GLAVSPAAVTAVPAIAAAVAAVVVMLLARGRVAMLRLAPRLLVPLRRIVARLLARRIVARLLARSLLPRLTARLLRARRFPRLLVTWRPQGRRRAGTGPAPVAARWRPPGRIASAAAA